MMITAPPTLIDDQISKPQNAAASSEEAKKAAKAIQMLDHRVRRIGTL